MANSSIYAAFERMWQHIIAKLGEKESKIDAESKLAEAKTYADEKIQESIDEALENIDSTVDSVNGKTGAVELTADDVGAVNKAGDVMTGPLTVSHNLSIDSNNGITEVKFDELASISTLNNDPRLIFSQHGGTETPDISYTEQYSLPTIGYKSGSYDILTTKSPVTIAQGGTEATTAAEALANLGGVSKSGDTITGTTSIQGTFYVKNSSGDNGVSVWRDNEGGNIRVYPPAEASVDYWEMDANTGTAFRIFARRNSSHPDGEGGVYPLWIRTDGKGGIDTQNVHIKSSDNYNEFLKIVSSDNNDRGHLCISDNNQISVRTKETGAAFSQVYRFPAPTSGLTETEWYDILTTKGMSENSGKVLVVNGNENGVFYKSIDTSATSGSANLITSGAVYTGLSGKSDTSHKHAAGDITSGTLSVARGGTGASTLASGQVLIGNGTSAVTTRAIINNAAKGSLGWSSATANGINIPTLNTLAFWNGRYNDSSSNLAYCVKGEFGDAATRAVATSATSGSTALITSGAVYTGLAGKLNTSGGTLTGALTAPSPLSITHSSTPAVYFKDTSGNIVGGVVSSVSARKTALRVYASDTSYYVSYAVQAPPTGLTANKNYNIITSTAAITIEYGSSLPTAGTKGRIYLKKA